MSTNGFFQLKIAKKVKETADAATLYFEIPAELKDTFAYLPGQYLTIKSQINGEEVRRSYSLCTFSEVDAMPAVTVKAVDRGRMSNYINNSVSEGDVLEVMAPMGKFTLTPDANKAQTYVLFAGGSGITPMMGISKAVMLKQPNSKVVLVYANRDKDSVIFKDAIAEMEKQFQGRFSVILSYDKAPLTWFGLKGFLTEDKIANILQNKIGGSFPSYEYYICGPSPMMDIVKTGLTKAGINKEHIYTEYFTAPVSDSATKTEEVKTEAAFTGTSQVTITVYGKTNTIKVDQNTTILAAAMKNGIDPPYSCTVGVCTTCRAKVNKGEVFMTEREGLTDDEIAKGYVLTCQSLPRSAEIELKFE